ncbi:MAG: diacylglycerol kinase family protein [Candidatus Sericytochromatia bacterium]
MNVGDSLARFFRAFGYAGRGIAFAFATQRNMRVHAGATLLACGLSFWLQLGSLEGAVLWLTLAAVMTAEMFNTSLETTLDLISREQHPQIGLAKDLAAGAVLISAIFAVLVGLSLWGPRLWERFGA